MDKCILRLDNAVYAKNYPEVKKFITKNPNPAADNPNIRIEIHMNDIRESHTLARFSGIKNVRVEGMDTLMTENYIKVFKKLRKFFGDFEFAPCNGSFCATALAAEFLTSGGSRIATSFSGVGGLAPTEEIIMILRNERLRKPAKTYECFPEMTRLIGEIVGEKVSKLKPVIGKNIFSVESGIHVDGIIKQPKTYEPFSPEAVGKTRKIIIGKHSGTSSIIAKMTELGIEKEHKNIPLILEKV
jgi:homocitrate synthase NifV